MMNRLSKPTLFGLALVVVLGCGRDRAPAPTTATTPLVEEEAVVEAPAAEPVPRHAEPCPMDVEGTSVEVEETAQGVALVFETQDGDVEALRREVQAMAVMHQQHHQREPHHAPGMMPDASVTTEPLEDGMRLEFTPRDPAQAEELRERVYSVAEEMQVGRCPTMMEPQGGMDGG
jgi:hypothetical protein